MCYFPTGAALRMCQSRVSGNDSEKRDGGRGRSGRQRPDFSQKAPDQWIGGRSALPGPINKHTEAACDGEIDPSEKAGDDGRRDRRK